MLLVEVRLLGYMVPHGAGVHCNMWFMSVSYEWLVIVGPDYAPWTVQYHTLASVPHSATRYSTHQRNFDRISNLITFVYIFSGNSSITTQCSQCSWFSICRIADFFFKHLRKQFTSKLEFDQNSVGGRGTRGASQYKDAVELVWGFRYKDKTVSRPWPYGHYNWNLYMWRDGLSYWGAAQCRFNIKMPTYLCWISHHMHKDASVGTP